MTQPNGRGLLDCKDSTLETGKTSIAEIVFDLNQQLEQVYGKNELRSPITERNNSPREG